MVLGDQKAQLLGDFFPFPGQKKQRLSDILFWCLKHPFAKKTCVKSNRIIEIHLEIFHRENDWFEDVFFVKPCRLSDSSMDRLIGDVPQASI